MPGPAPKSADRRQRRNHRAALEVHEGGGRIVRVPDPPTGLLKRTRERWEEYWRSDVAQAIEPDSDMPAVERLFQLYDERLRAYEGYRKNRLVEGSQGQPVLNPLASIMQKCDAEIRALEDRLGMNPKARLQLGIQMTEARKGLNALMDGLEPDYDDDDSDGEETEARVV